MFNVIGFHRLEAAMLGPNETKMIDAATLAAWLQAGEVDLYDVREEPEFAAGRIPGSTLVPLSAFDPNAVDTDSSRHLVFHCKSGVRCGMATEIMRASGFEGTIHRLEGGILAWNASGGNIQPGND
jgi:rhodanese-related sulfurtransferase